MRSTVISAAARTACMATLFAIFAMFDAPSGASAAPLDVEMWRLDCGEFKDFDIEGMSDVFSYSSKKETLADGCYLIRHGKDFMLWDTGLPPSSIGQPIGLKQTLVAQLQKISIRPEQISIVGLSHWHFDHTGQAAQFPQARLLIGKEDFEYLAGKHEGATPDDIAPWLSSSTKVKEVVGDEDVFGDGSVIMLATPGHTAGHHSLLVRLLTFGPVVLSGDLWHFSEQFTRNEVPPENVSRADTLASMDRVRRIISNLRATLIIQHEQADISKLPLFPASAR